MIGKGSAAKGTQRVQRSVVTRSRLTATVANICKQCICAQLWIGLTGYQPANNVHTAGRQGAGQKKAVSHRRDRGRHEATERPIHDESLNGLKASTL